LHELASTKLAQFPNVQCVISESNAVVRRQGGSHDKEGAFNQERAPAVQPGQCVLVDHFVCSANDRLFSSSCGKTKIPMIHMMAPAMSKK
jgi:hypothetical protein